MAYTIYKSTGGDAITINDGIILEDFYNQNANGVGKGLGIRLLGRNVIDYGAIVAQNFLQLASNFASDTAPSDSTALHGQLWFNSVNKRLYVNAGSVNTGDPALWIGIVGGKPYDPNDPNDPNDPGDTGGAATAPAVGAPIHDIDGILKGYTSAFIPSGSTTADYVPLHLDELRYFLGWLRKTSGDGMTVQITDSSNVPIGYAFPTTM